MGLMDMLRNWQEKQNTNNDKVTEFRKSRNPDTQDEVLISKRMEYKKWQEMEEKEKLKKALDEKKKEFTSKNMFGNKENSIVQDYEYRQAQLKGTAVPVVKKSSPRIKGATKYKEKIKTILKGDHTWKVSNSNLITNSQRRAVKSMRVAPRPQVKQASISILSVNSGFIKKTENLNKSKVRVMNNGGVKVL